MRGLLRWLLVGLVILVANEAVADRSIDGVPIPDDAAVIAAEPAAAFSGAWLGLWDGKIKHILIVGRIKDDGKADVVFALGDAPQLGIRHGWVRPDARVNGDTLTVTGTDFSASYRMTSANWAEASYARGALTGKAELTRVSVAALLAPDMTFANVGESIMIDSGLLENEEPVRLQVVIFKPEGPGPFPLLVVNHGSTGKGTDPEAFKHVHADRAFAKIFVSKGYLVAYPQRRGRGKSDGLYDEGFYTDRTLGYTCEPERSLAGAERALGDIAAAVAALRQRSDVADRPVLMAGGSRGGALSIAYAGMHPHDIAGVINFVGGWISEACGLVAKHLNTKLLGRGGAYRGPTLWLYGLHDRFYSLAHSGENFVAFRAAGGKGTFLPFEVSQGGHALMSFPPLWTPDVNRYLNEIRTPGGN
jgi:dienelactone hydrolase